MRPPPKKTNVWPWIIVAVVLLMCGGGALSALTGESSNGRNGAAKAGSAVRDGQFEFAITKFEQGAKELGSGLSHEVAKGEFILVHVKVTNTGKEQRSFSPSDQKLIDDQGREFTAGNSLFDPIPNNGTYSEDLNPGFSVERVVFFDVPIGTVPKTMEFHDSGFSGGAKVALK
ncbi:DUF4352 domain-containing protein [Nocardia sp. NPDC055321]